MKVLFRMGKHGFLVRENLVKRVSLNISDREAIIDGSRSC